MAGWKMLITQELAGDSSAGTQARDRRGCLLIRRPDSAPIAPRSAPPSDFQSCRSNQWLLKPRRVPRPICAADLQPLRDARLRRWFDGAHAALGKCLTFWLLCTQPLVPRRPAWSPCLCLEEPRKVKSSAPGLVPAARTAEQLQVDPDLDQHL